MGCIPELIIPSYYTSTACTVNSLVDASMRQGEIFYCLRCNVKEHAADTIGNYLLLCTTPVQQMTLRLSKGQLSARNCVIGSPTNSFIFGYGSTHEHEKQTIGDVVTDVQLYISSANFITPTKNTPTKRRIGCGMNWCLLFYKNLTN
jgi:hypothetical protein